MLQKIRFTTKHMVLIPDQFSNMPYTLHCSNDLLDPVSDMGYGSEAKKCSERPSKTIKQKIPPPQLSRSLKFHDKVKVEKFISERYVDPDHASKQIHNKRLVVQPKHSETRQKQWVRSKVFKDEELVKHMSNVPCYLQRMDARENVQEKALNFGVLNWENLEKWKPNQKHFSIKHNTKSPSILNSSLSKEKDICNMDSETALVSASNGEKQASPTDWTFGRTQSEQKNEKCKGKILDEKILTVRETSSTDLINCDVMGTLNAKPGSTACENVKLVEGSQGHNTSCYLQSSSGEYDNVAHHSPVQVVSQFSTLRTSLDSKYSAEMLINFSGGLSPQMVHSRDLYSDMQHSCPLPCTVETNSTSDRKRSITRDTPHMELPSGTESSRISSYATTELSVKKVRSPSPSRLFSMGIGRISRSMSFKEGITVPKLSSTYVSVSSGPVHSEASTCMDYSSRNNVHSTNRARSSPLRRLLDPLLKPKTPNQPHSAELLKMSSTYHSNIKDSIQDEKHKASTIHALLQLSTKNGLPLFKFVVDNNSNILAATMTKPIPSSNDDSSDIFTLYSVNEAKKKSGSWTSQGSKDKSCGYVYTVAGQMKILTSQSYDLTGNEADQFITQESVLYGGDLRHIDQRSPTVIPNMDLAAIVVKTPKEKTFSNSLGEDNITCCSSTVVLPGGIHGIPTRGAPSPLLDRWRSVGSCDCGGWDLGCRLSLLSTKKSRTRSVVNRFELFSQGGTQENKPCFSLAPFKNNIYSVEFKGSISLLQAFFICIAVKSGNNTSVTRTLQETPLAHGEVPTKFMSCPPISPTGRV